MSISDQIKTEPDAYKMRNLIAEGIKENKDISDSANSTAQEAKDTADNANNRVNNIISGQIEGKDQEILDAHYSNVTGQTSANIGSRMDGFDSQLADKANQSYVDSKFGQLGSIFTFKGSDTTANINAKTGATVGDYWYSTDGNTNLAWNGTSWVDIGNNLKIGDNTITPEKTSFFDTIEYKNLFNKNNVTTGWINTDGTFNNDSNYSHSDYITLKENTDYIPNHVVMLSYYDASKNYIGYNSTSVTFNTSTAVADKIIAYVIVSIGNYALDTAQLELGTIQTTYAPYIPPIEIINEQYVPLPQELIDSRGTETNLPTRLNKMESNIGLVVKTIETSVVNDTGKSIVANNSESLTVFSDAKIKSGESIDSITLTVYNQGGSAKIRLWTEQITGTITEVSSLQIDVVPGDNVINLPYTAAYDTYISVQRLNSSGIGFVNSTVGMMQIADIVSTSFQLSSLENFPSYGLPISVTSYHVESAMSVAQEAISLSRKDYILVDINGNGDYTSLQSAITNANDGDIIYIKNGIYSNEIVEAYNKNVTIIGESKTGVIIKNATADYYTPPLEIARGTVKNITFYAENDGVTTTPEGHNGNYAIHVESNNLANSNLTFENCVFKSDWNSSFGMGMRGGCHVLFDRCEFHGQGTYGHGIFFHDTDVVGYFGVQNVSFRQCIITSQSNQAMRIDSMNVTGSTINVEFIGNVLVPKAGMDKVLLVNQTDPVTNPANITGLVNYNMNATCFGNNETILNV